MQQFIAWVTAHWSEILAVWGALVALATLIVKLTPSQADDAFLAKVIKLVDYFSVVNPKKTGDQLADIAAEQLIKEAEARAKVEKP